MFEMLYCLLTPAVAVGVLIAAMVTGWLVAAWAMKAGRNRRGCAIWIYVALVVALLSAAALLNYTWDWVGEPVHFLLWVAMLVPLGFMFWCGICSSERSSKIST